MPNKPYPEGDHRNVFGICNPIKPFVDMPFEVFAQRLVVDSEIEIGDSTAHPCGPLLRKAKRVRTVNDLVRLNRAIERYMTAWHRRQHPAPSAI
jgi:hypothetical protein